MKRRTPSNKLRPAVFLDRDGTLIEDRGNLSDPSQEGIALEGKSMPRILWVVWRRG